LKPFSNDDYEASIEFLREFARQRSQLVLAQTAAERLGS
jgi:hypothetical protein